MSETFTSATSEPDAFTLRQRSRLSFDLHVDWNASGHHLGTVMPGFGLPIGELIARIGFEDTRELWSLSKQGADYVRANATEELIPGIALSEGALEVSNVEI